jgi:hypothetical protein
MPGPLLLFIQWGPSLVELPWYRYRPSQKVPLFYVLLLHFVVVGEALPNRASVLLEDVGGHLKSARGYDRHL